MKTNLLGLAVLAAVSLSSFAFADGRDGRGSREVHGAVALDQHFGQRGHWEERYVKFAPNSHGGRLQRVWVPETVVFRGDRDQRRDGREDCREDRRDERQEFGRRPAPIAPRHEDRRDEHRGPASRGTPPSTRR